MKSTKTAKRSEPIYLTTNADNSYGIYGLHDGLGRIDIAASSDITTEGENGYGISAWARNEASSSAISVRQSGGAISTSGVGGEAITVSHGGSGSMNVETAAGSTITTTGEKASGIAAFDPYKKGNGAINISTGGTIHTTGATALGVMEISGGDATVNIGADVTTAGQYGAGVAVKSTSATGRTAVNIQQGVTVTGGWQALPGTSGGRFDAPSAGVVLGGTTAQLNNHGNINALSDRAIAAATDLVPASSDITLNNYGTITGYLSLAGAGQRTFNNYSSNSLVMRNFADTNGDGIRDTKGVTLSDFGVHGSLFNNSSTGMVRFGKVTTNTLTDTTGQYVPTTGIDSRPLEAGFYDITRSGVVQGQFVNLTTFNNAGTIDLRGPAVGNVLLMTGNPDTATAVAGSLTRGEFVSDGGRLITNVKLNEGIAPTGQSNSYADMLVVDSARLGTGATRVIVHNLGGLGGWTTGNGIELIEVRDKTAGASDPGAFVLGAPAAVGAYSYQLQQHGVGADGADGNWYLRSSIVDPDAPGKRLKTYRPQVPVYMAVPALASRMGLDMLGTYHDRLGEDYSHSVPAMEANPKAGWGRVYGSTLKTQLDGKAASRLNQFEQDGPAYTSNIIGFQVGTDLYRRPYTTYSDVAGAYLGYSHGNADVQNVLDDNTAGTVKIDAYSLGGYWTRKGASGWYVDGVLQATLYGSVKAESQGQRLSTDGWGLAASVEAGYPIDVGADWKLEPQGQLIYQHLKVKNASDEFAQVRYADQDAVHARIGARLDKTFTTNDGRQFTPWLRANLWFSPEQQASTTFATTTGAHPTTLNTKMGGTWAQIGAGLSGQIEKNVSVFASADYNREIGGRKGQGVTGRIGVKIAW